MKQCLPHPEWSNHKSRGCRGQAVTVLGMFVCKWWSTALPCAWETEICLLCPHRCEESSGLCEAKPKWGAESGVYPGRFAVEARQIPAHVCSLHPTLLAVLRGHWSLGCHCQHRSWWQVSKHITVLCQQDSLPSLNSPNVQDGCSGNSCGWLQCLCLLMPMEQGVVSHWSL